MIGGVFIGGIALKSEACRTRSLTWEGEGINKGVMIYWWLMAARSRSKGGRTSGVGWRMRLPGRVGARNGKMNAGGTTVNPGSSAPAAPALGAVQGV